MSRSPLIRLPLVSGSATIGPEVSVRIVVIIPACHAGDRGSIPRPRVFCGILALFLRRRKKCKKLSTSWRCCDVLGTTLKNLIFAKNAFGCLRSIEYVMFPACRSLLFQKPARVAFSACLHTTHCHSLFHALNHKDRRSRSKRIRMCIRCGNM